MKKLFTRLIIPSLILTLSYVGYGQQFVAVPEFPTENENLVITYDATGTILEGLNEVYVFATAQRQGGTTLKAGWLDVATTPGLLTTRNGNIYTLTISGTTSVPGIRGFFPTLPPNEAVYRLGFTFRDAVGTLNGGNFSVNVNNSSNPNIVAFATPADPDGIQDVVITFRADKGDQGLLTFTGQVYAYTFANVQFGTSDLPAPYNLEFMNPFLAMSNIGPNLYTMTIPGIRNFYSISGTTKVDNLGFVFKNYNGTITGGDINSFNVYVPVNIKAKQVLDMGTINDVTMPYLSTAVVTVTSTISSGFNVSYSVASTPANIAVISGSTITVSGAGTVTVTATQMGNQDYLPTENYTTFQVNTTPIPQTITFPTLAGVSFEIGTTYFKVITLTGTASSGLPVTYTVAANPSNIATVSGNLLTLTGIGNVTVTAYQFGNMNYNPAAPEVRTFEAKEIYPLVSSMPALITNDGPVVIYFNANLNNNPNLINIAPADMYVYAAANNFAYIKQEWDNVGSTPELKMTRDNIDQNLYTLTIPSIRTFFAIPSAVKVYELNLIFRNQAGNQQTNNLLLNTTILGLQNITFPALGNISVSGAATGTVTLQAVASSGLPITYNVTSTGTQTTLSGNSLVVKGAGTVTVTANQVGNANFEAATPVTRTFTVTTIIGPAPQTITMPTYSEILLVQGTTGVVTLSGSATSGLPVTFTVANGGVTVVRVGDVLTVSGNGVITVTGSQSGNSDFLAAPNVIRTIPVRTVPPRLTISPSTPEANGSVTITFNPEVGTIAGLKDLAPANMYVYAYINTQVPGTTTTGFYEKATWADVPNTPSLQAVRDNSNENLYTFTLSNIRSFFSGVPNNHPITNLVVIFRNAAGNVQTENIEITLSTSNNTISGPSSQVITFGEIETQSVSGSNVGTIILSASASSNLAVSYSIVSSPADMATLSGASLSFRGPATITVTASQVGNNDYLAATPVTRVFEVVTVSGPVPRPMLSTNVSVIPLTSPFIIYFNAGAPAAPASLKNNDDKYIYGGIRTTGGIFQFINYSWAAVSTIPSLKMTLVPGEAGETMLYAITIPNLRAFFNVPETVADADILGIDIIFRNAQGNAQTDDLLIPIVPTSVKEAVSSLSVSVYPNPSQGTFTVVSSSNGTYSIYSLTGVTVASGALSEGANTVSTNLAPGVYLLRVGSSVTRLVVE